MDNQELQKLVEDISIKYFHKPFRHRAIFNNRLKTTGGRYLLKSHDIEMNIKYYQQLGIEELVGIIKHELCHYHLHIEGKGYKHRDKDFKELMEVVGAPRYCSSLPENSAGPKSQKVNIYICNSCNQIYRRKRRMDTKKYVCGICRGALSLKKN
ncbi:SprT family protein [Bacillus tuaregi]|uniref:SprT family protein n=1 Tax=Bacillus tuaregi TaxID=1816695 RepID=UPI0008F92B6B|nr:SprT family protein [Bacillus tuaregi]